MSEQSEIPTLHLPGGWCWATFSAVATIAANLVPPQSWGDSPHIAPDNIARDTGRLLPFKTVAEDGVISANHLFRPGQLLYSKIRPYLNKCVRVDFQGLCSADMYPLDAHIYTAYLHYYILSRQFVAGVTEAAGSRTILPKTNQAQLSQVPISVAPEKEQRRIAEALESYFTRLDDAVATLERVERNLKRYRASVLKSAVEGRLVPTEAALAKQEGRTYEPASVLLQRILTERRRRWSESGKKGKYQEPAPPDTTKLPKLPEGWCWATVDMLADVKGGVTKGQKRKIGERLREVPYLRVANVQRGYLDLSEVKTIEATEDEILEMGLKNGDVLFNEGGDRDKLGRGWVWAGELPECIHQNHVFRARLLLDDVEPRYLSWYGNGPGQAYFFDEGKQTTNLASINLTKLKGLPVPIPPRLEQARIVEEADRLLSVVDECAIDAVRNTHRTQRLRQSILKWAFEGKLADQDPTDEPASVLLERIKAERNPDKPAKTAPPQRKAAKKKARA